MKKIHTFLLFSTTLSLFTQNILVGDQVEETTKVESTLNQKQIFTPFTAKISKNKVRMRLAPTYDSPIIKQFEQGSMLVVTGEEDDFYAVEPPAETKAYIYRTFVLDGVVEGKSVNVRLEPNTDASILTKLDSGEKVDGKISPLNNKWLEIPLPPEVKFYINKDLVEKVGDKNFLVAYQKKKAEVEKLYNETFALVQKSEKEAFGSIDYEKIAYSLKSIIDDYADIDTYKIKASELLATFNDSYNQKRVADLEKRSKEFCDVETLQKERNRLSLAIHKQKQQLEELSKEMGTRKATKVIASVGSDTLSAWMPKEEIAFENWKFDNEDGCWETFYNEEVKRAKTITGRLQPYEKNVNNKPGDYVILNSHNVPVAFVYSTLVELKDYVGKNVTVNASKRPNNNFAYPAFFVLKVE